MIVFLEMKPIVSRMIPGMVLALTLTACPYPPDPPGSFKLYQANLTSATTTMYGNVGATQGSTVLSIGGDIFNTGSGDVFTANLKCLQPQPLSMGFIDGHPTIYGTIARDAQLDQNALESGQCSINVVNSSGVTMLTGFLKSHG